MTESALRREVRKDIAFSNHCPTTIIEVVNLILSRAECMSREEMGERGWRLYRLCVGYKERYLCRLNGHDDQVHFFYDFPN
jgi:hypothetical protein